MARIAVVGLWHQGTVLSACLANLGHRVKGVEEDAKLVASLRAAHPPVREPGLVALLRLHLRSGRLEFTTDYPTAVRGAEFAYIAFDTPIGPGDEPDLTPIFDAARHLARAMTKPVTVVVTAQVPVGTCERLEAVIAQDSPGARASVAYVPEFLRLGAALQTFRLADRIVIGADDPLVARRVGALYRSLGRPIVTTTVRTAEMGKQASNAFLALSISAINELADICENVGADVAKVAEIMRLDRRIGRQAYLDAGLGFAGGTLGRDIRGLQQLARASGCETALLDAVMWVNEARAGLVTRRLREVYSSLDGVIVGVLGITYKPGTSTLRRSIALEIIADLVRQGASVKTFDPLADLKEADSLPPFTACGDPYAAVTGCDAAVLITPWDGIARVDLSRMRAVMRHPVFVDTRNLFEPAQMQRMGFTYVGVGRGNLRRSNPNAPRSRGKEQR